MKVDIAHVNDVERRMTVAVPSDRVSGEIDKAYKELKKTVKLRGFRPGKAPISILQKHFKAQVEEDVISKIVQDTYPKALDEVKAAPVCQPKIENGVLEKGKDFSYTAVFEIKPDIDVKDYEGLELEQEKIEVNDEDLNRELENLRNSCATMNDIEGRAAQKGDHVIFDFDGTIGGEPYAGGKKSDFFLEIMDDAFLPGFTKELEGLKVGDSKEFSISLPEDYFDKDTAGKTIDFSVLMKNIKEKVLPALDDEFAKDVGSYTGLDDLKEKISERLKMQQQEQADGKIREKIFDQLIEKNEFELPKSMVEMQARNMIMDVQQMLNQQGLKLEDMGQSVGQLFEQYREPAERQVRSALLLNAIADKEKLEATAEEIDEKYQEVADQVGQDLATVKAKVSPDMIRPQILEKKALDFIKSKAKITEK